MTGFEIPESLHILTLEFFLESDDSVAARFREKLREKFPSQIASKLEKYVKFLKKFID